MNEHRGKDQKLLIDQLLSYNADGEEAEHVSLNLFIEPSVMKSKTWQVVLATLARRGLIQMLVVDEAHSISQAGRHFRPEFVVAVKYLGHPLTLMPYRVPRVLLSATMLKSDIDIIVELLKDKPPIVLHGRLDRRTISFKVIISGSSASSLKKNARRDFKARPNAQQIWYTHSRKKS